MKKIFFVFLLTALAACQGNSDAAKNSSQTDLGPTTVIDFPARGAILPYADVVIQAHADDPLGVTYAEVSIGGEMLAKLNSLHLGQPTAIFTYTWHPQTYGEATLSIRSQNTVGTWGAPATMQIVFISPTPTATAIPPTAAPPTATATQLIPTPTTTTVVPDGSSLTLTPTGTLDATPAPAVPDEALDSFGVVLTPRFSALHFYPANSNCLPNDSGMTVIVSDITNVANVFAFFTMTDTGVYHFPAHRWTTGLIMWQSAPGSPYFWRAITSKSIIPYVDYYPNYVLYQIVATDRNGSIVARSPIYRDMSIVKCEK